MTRANLTPETRAFLRDWMAWVERGAPDRKPYLRCDGLCLASIDAPGREPGDMDLYDGLCAAFGDNDHPFGKSDYRARYKSRTMHECPARLAWVRANMEDE